MHSTHSSYGRHCKGLRKIKYAFVRLPLFPVQFLTLKKKTLRLLVIFLKRRFSKMCECLKNKDVDNRLGSINFPFVSFLVIWPLNIEDNED